MKSWKWFVYILLCKDNSYYVGKTWKPELRYDQHLSGLGGEYTKRHGVTKLAYLEEYSSFEEAKLREAQLKRWTRIKKEKLIKGIWKKI